MSDSSKKLLSISVVYEGVTFSLSGVRAKEWMKRNREMIEEDERYRECYGETMKWDVTYTDPLEDTEAVVKAIDVLVKYRNKLRRESLGII